MKTYNTIEKLVLNTANRGTKEYIISTDSKGYFAHEIGEQTQFSKVFGNPEFKAHRINKSMRYGNQYVRSFKPKPFTSINEANAAINEYSQQVIYHF